MYFLIFLGKVFSANLRKRFLVFMNALLIFFCLMRSWILNGMLVFRLMESVNPHDGVCNDVGCVIIIIIFISS